MRSIVLPIIILLLTVSCRKSDNNNEVMIPLVDIWTFYSATAKFEYDANNRVIKMTTDVPNGVHSVVDYEYLTDTIKKIERDTVNGIIQLSYLILNNKGLVTKIRTEFYPNGTWPSYTWFFYEYDDNDHCIMTKRQAIRLNDNLDTIISKIEQLDYYIWKDGNHVQTIKTVPVNDTSYITYLSDRLNTIGHTNFGLKFEGQQSKNPVFQIKYLNGFVNTYSYDYDKNGLIVRRLTSDSSRVDTFQYK